MRSRESVSVHAVHKSGDTVCKNRQVSMRQTRTMIPLRSLATVGGCRTRGWRFA